MPMGPVERARRSVRILTALLVGAVASPALFETGEALFPLSDYPMFARGRPPVETLFFVEVARPDGALERVPARLVSGGGAGKARQQLQEVPRARKSAQLAYCRTLAAGVAGAGELRIVRGEFSLARLRRTRAAEPDRRTVVVSCPVPG
jgi:hypothetical protein